jgi:hypothetical protein
VRLRIFLALSATLLVVVGLTVAISDRLDSGGKGSDQVLSDGGSDGSSDGGALADGGGDGADGSLPVSGHVTEVHLEGAVLDPRTVDTPLTISSDRGLGNGGEVTGVEVGGKASSIVWDGGRPFVLSSGPGLQLDPVTVELVQGQLLCGLADGAHTLKPGDYQLDTPVAVGGSGIATPHESVAFTADAHSLFRGEGDAALQLSKDDSHTFKGPGLVHLVGQLVITTEQGDQPAGSLDLSQGPYELTFSPTEGGGWTVSGRVQSKVIGDLVLGDA